MFGHEYLNYSQQLKNLANHIKECEAEISSLKTRIKWLEENIKLYEQQNSESDARLKVKKDEVQQQIENFVGARIFE